jgi:signal transduction histidine kinase
MDDLSERNRERERLLTHISGFNDELRSQVEAATRELSASNQALLQAQQRLIRSERLAVAGQMATSLAHEIGTPLNAISGHLQLLARDHPDAADTQRRVQIITQQLDFIVGIVRRLLEWAHKKQPRFRPTDFNLLMREILTLVSPSLEQHAVAVSTDLSDDLPPIPVDRDGLYQVFLNLINNSLDAMPDGGRLQISTRLDPDNQRVELILRDTGIGVDSGALEHIFEPMWTTKPSGSGFGLAIAREIITEHGGRIEAVREQRQGATFILRLPISNAGATPETRKEVMANVA